MKIIYSLLVRTGACVAQRDKFCELFPNGVTVTRDLCVQHAQDFHWNWAARNLLSDAAFDAYVEALAPAEAAYKAAVVEAYAPYDAVAGPAYAAYTAALAAFETLAKNAYLAAVMPAKDAYLAAEAPIRIIYNAAMASAFATACGCP
jgi:hypothetical protein